MSKEKALDFLSKAAADQQLKQQLQDVDHPTELVDLAQQHGYEFSSDHLKQAIPAIQEKRGFFGDLVDAVLGLFAPTHDDYPSTGVQPFSGDPKK